MNQKRFYCFMIGKRIKIQEEKPQGFEEMNIKKEYILPPSRKELLRDMFNNYVESLKFR